MTSRDPEEPLIGKHDTHAEPKVRIPNRVFWHGYIRGMLDASFCMAEVFLVTLMVYVIIDSRFVRYTLFVLVESFFRICEYLLQALSLNLNIDHWIRSAITSLQRTDFSVNENISEAIDRILNATQTPNF